MLSILPFVACLHNLKTLHEQPTWMVSCDLAYWKLLLQITMPHKLQAVVFVPSFVGSHIHRQILTPQNILNIQKQYKNNKMKKEKRQKETSLQTQTSVSETVLNNLSNSVHSGILIRYLQGTDSLYMNHRWLLQDVSLDLWPQHPFHVACRHVSAVALVYCQIHLVLSLLLLFIHV